MGLRRIAEAHPGDRTCRSSSAMTTRPESTDTDARTSRLRELIRGVYQRQNPSKLNDLDGLFKKYLGSEVNLYKAICLKYSLQPDALAVEGSTTASAPAVLGDASRGSPSSGQGSVGVLLLLRWPSDTPRHMAPDVLQPAWAVPDAREQTVYALLPEGTSRSEKEATQAAASMAVHLLALSNVPRDLDEALSAACADGPLLCRYQAGSRPTGPRDFPRSAATWARLEAPQLPAHRPAPHCTALHCPALHGTPLHCNARHGSDPHCVALHCTALHSCAAHCTAWLRWPCCYCCRHCHCCCFR